MSGRRARAVAFVALLVVLVGLALLLVPLPDDGPEEAPAPPGTGSDESGPVRVSDRGVVVTDRVAVASFAVDRPARIATRFLDGDMTLIGERRLTIGQAGSATARIALARPVEALSAVVTAIPIAGGRPAVVRTAAARRLALRIVSPAPGSAIEGSRVLVRVAVRGLQIGDPSGVPGPWRGHLDLTLDRRPPIRLNGTGIVLRGLAPGRHRLAVRADRSDHSPFPGLEQPATVAFSTRAGLPEGPPTPPGSLPGPDDPLQPAP